jgi:hypothetical protein
MKPLLIILKYTIVTPTSPRKQEAESKGRDPVTGEWLAKPEPMPPNPKKAATKESFFTPDGTPVQIETLPKTDWIKIEKAW